MPLFLGIAVSTTMLSRPSFHTALFLTLIHFVAAFADAKRMCSLQCEWHEYCDTAFGFCVHCEELCNPTFHTSKLCQLLCQRYHGRFTTGKEDWEEDYEDESGDFLVKITPRPSKSTEGSMTEVFRENSSASVMLQSAIHYGLTTGMGIVVVEGVLCRVGAWTFW